MFTRSLVAGLLLVAPAAAGILKVPQDHDTIQGAVDAAGNGDTIQVSKGTYHEAVVIDGFTDLLLVAKGKVIVDGAGGAAGITLSNCTGCRIEKVRVENAPGDGIRIQAGTDCSLFKCRLAGNGIRIEGGSGLVIEKCSIHDAALDAILLTADAADPVTGATLLKNKIFDAADDGLDINGLDCRAEKNLIQDVLGDGVELSDAQAGGANEFLSNRIIRAGGAGFIVNGADNRFVKNRIVNSLGSDGLHLLSGDGHVVEDNKITKPTDDGVKVETEATTAAVRRNKITKPGDDGITCEGPDAFIDANKISGAAEDGIQIDGTGGLYTDNKVNGSQNDGFLIALGTGNELSGNVAKGSQEGFDLHDMQVGLNTIDSTNSFGTTSP